MADTTTSINPLREGIRIHRTPEPCAMVIFGASGDLTERKLIPALFYLSRERMLPAGFSVIGCARTLATDDSFRQEMGQAVKKYLKLSTQSDAIVESFGKGIYYIADDFSDPAAYDQLKVLLDRLDRERGASGNRLFYLATPPSFFPVIVKRLGAAGLATPKFPQESWTRIIIEKPFGRDLSSARELNQVVTEVFKEEQVYRIDHYLGKETVQNLLVMRYANGIFEPFWNRRYIDHVQLAVAEDLGVENRGSYYEEAGLVRDMIQNHVLQLLSLVAMEPPSTFDATSVRDEKAKVLRAIRPLAIDRIDEFVVRGQYTDGWVVGKNLGLNAQSKGFTVAGFDLDIEKSKKVGEEAEGKIQTTGSWQEFVDALETPRRIWMMVPAGKPVDSVIETLKPYLTPEDILIDGGNSYFRDTERRARELEASGLRFFGMGVSGGEEGALHGPSLMPGGFEESYRHLEPVLTKMAAQTSDGACCTYLGPGGAGHYVKMVHNGVEYGIMQTICEAYDIFKNVLGLSGLEIRDIFAEWNNGDLGSFLLEISIIVLGKIDPETNQPLVDLVLDTAEQKGTGKWTAQDALDLGAPVPTLTAAVIARIISGAKEERIAVSEFLRGPSKKFSADKKQFIARVREAYKITVLGCYTQGFEQLRIASQEYKYNLKFEEIARIWKGGCIIRAKLLDPIRTAFQSQPGLENLMLAPYFRKLLNKTGGSLRKVVRTATDLGTPIPALSNTLAYIDAYRSKRLPANLLQAQRDYFGAHTYRRIDKEGKFHTEWDK